MTFFNLFGLRKTNGYECSSAISLSKSINFNFFDKLKESCGSSFASSFSYNFNRLFSENISYVKSNCYSGISYEKMYNFCLDSSYKTGCNTRDANNLISDLTIKVSEVITTHWGNDALIKEKLKCVAPSEVLCNLIVDYYSSLKSSKNLYWSCNSVSISIGLFSKSCFGSLIICGSIDFDWYKSNCNKKKIWCDGSLDIVIDKIKDLFDESLCIKSPLVLDLDGDGVETTALNNSKIYFDHDNNGYAEKTGWAGKDDGFLVIDKNNNNSIDNGLEMFGNNTSSSAANGFIALKDYDSNNDGIINFFDKDFEKLKIWQDKNQNGITDKGELTSLYKAGIKSISTGYNSSNITDSNGNIHKETGVFTRLNGSQGAINDVWFQVNAAKSKDLNKVELSQEIASMPNLSGFGNVSDLQQVMQKDTSGKLKKLIESFTSSTNASEKISLMNDIIFAWAGVENIDPESLITAEGKNYIGDARKVYALEHFLANDFKGLGCSDISSKVDEPNAVAAAVLNKAYGELIGYMYGRLLAQTSQKELINQIDSYWKNDSCAVNTSCLRKTILSMYSSDKNKAISTIYELGSALSSLGTTGKKALSELKMWGNTITDNDLAFTLSHMDMIPTYGTSGHDHILNNGFNNRLVFGYDGNDILYGSSGSDIIYGGKGNDRFDNRLGNDYMYGGEGDDYYFFTAECDSDTINDTAGNDLINFTKTAESKLWFAQENNNLVISIIGTESKLTIEDWYSSSSNHIESFKSKDGKILLDSQVQNLVNAMASLTPPAAGQTTLPQSYQDQLAPVLAANWK